MEEMKKGGRTRSSRKKAYAEGGSVDVYGKHEIHEKGKVKDIDSLHEVKAMKKGGHARKAMCKAEGGAIRDRSAMRPMKPEGFNPTREMGMVKNIDTLHEEHGMKKGGRAVKKCFGGEIKPIRKAAGGAAKVRKGMMTTRGRVI